MKRKIILGVVLMMALVLSATGLAGAKSTFAPAQDMFPNAGGTMAINFDGYCDGNTVTLNPANGVVTAQWTNACVSCPFPDVVGAGTLGTIRKQGTGVTVGWNKWPEDGQIGFFTVLRADHTWTLYYFNGSVLNAGTWSECTLLTAQGAAGKGPSFAH